MAQDSHAAQIWTALPGIVESVNLAAQTVSVQPAIQGVVTAEDGAETAVNLPVLVDVPICWPRAGGLALTFPVTAGDEVLVVFSSRCIDSWWQSGGIGPQAESRMHDLSDGFAVLAPTSQAKVLSNVSTTEAQLRTEDESVCIGISAEGITLKGNIVHSGGGTIVSNGRRIDGGHTHSGVQPGGSNTGAPNA